MTHPFLYVTAMLLMALSVSCVVRAARALRLPVFTSAGLIGAFLLYASMLIPGVLGLLTPAAGVVTLAVLSFALVPACRHLAHAAEAVPGVLPGTFWRERFSLGWGELLTLIAAASLIYPLSHALLTSPLSWLEPAAPLGWDTVSYHLPGIIEFIKRETLWSMEGPYQSYHFGYEMIFGFGLLFFRVPWSLPFIHTVALLLLISAVVQVMRWLGEEWFRHGHVSLPVALGATIGIWSLFFRSDFNEIGKNDVFRAACVLLAFVHVGYLWEEKASFKNPRYIALLALTSIALGLAAATKPSALAYLFSLPALLGFMLWNKRVNGGVIFLSVELLFAAAFLISGFFPLKNYLVLGSPVDPALAGQIQEVLLWNLTNPAVYTITPGTLGCAASLLALGASALIAFRRPANDRHLRWLGFVVFSLVALLTLSATPFFLFDATGVPRWEIRLGMVFFSTGAIVLGFAAGAMGAVAARAGSKLLRPAFAAAFLLVCTLPVYWLSHPVQGLPGYDRLQGPAETGVYRWIQSLDRPYRLYAAGLRPYGVLGREWRNEVFCDFHSTILDGEYGKTRLSLIMLQFRPDYLIVSIDPHTYSLQTEKPLLRWLRSQPWLSEEYCDDVASAFKVVEEPFPPVAPGTGIHPVRMTP